MQVRVNFSAMNMLSALRTFYKNLGVDGLLILSLFAFSIFTYFIFITHHLFHNHASRFPWLLSWDHMGSGRWLAPWLGHLHYNADLPIFTPVLGLSLGIFAAILTLRRWNFNAGQISKFIVLALIIAYPAMLSYFYYTFMTVLFFASTFFACAAFYVCSRLSVVSILSSAALILLMMASYQSALSIFVTISILAVIADLMRTPDLHGLRSALALLAARALSAVIGGVAYLLSLSLLNISPPRSITYTSWEEIPERVLEISRVSFEHLGVTQPELLAPVKIALGIILAAAALISVYKTRKSPIVVIAVITLWPLAVIATKAVFMFVEPDGSLWEYRYNGSLGFLYAFGAAVLITGFSLKFLSAAAHAAAIFVLVSFVQADQFRQGVLLRGQIHDLALANRILARIETLPDLDSSREYDLIRVGRYSFYRLHLMRAGGRDSAFYRLGDGHMDVGEISDRWVDEEVFRALGSGVRFRQTGTDPQFSAKIQRVQNELLEGRRPWPAPESVFINDDEIIVYMRNE